MNKDRVYLYDVLERVGWTFVEFVAGALLDIFTQGTITWRAVGYGVVIALCKAILAQKVGDANSAATLPSPPDYAVPPTEYLDEDDDIPVI